MLTTYKPSRKNASSGTSLLAPSLLSCSLAATRPPAGLPPVASLSLERFPNEFGTNPVPELEGGEAALYQRICYGDSGYGGKKNGQGGSESRQDGSEGASSEVAELACLRGGLWVVSMVS